MKLDQMQGAIESLLAAVPAINNFAPFIVHDDVTDFEPIIEAALEAKGACIAICRQAGGQRDSAAGGRRVLSRALIGVYVYDQPQVSHSPSGDTLLQQVVTAIISDGRFEYETHEAAEREKGGIECLSIFSAQVIF